MIVDPGPASSVETLLDGARGGAPRPAADPHPPRPRGCHGGAGAPLPGAHDLRSRGGRAAPGGPLEAAAERRSGCTAIAWSELWGEVAPVDPERIQAVAGGEAVRGFRVAYTPGHASHHVCYLHEASGDAYVGDMAGVRLPPHEYTVAPTPPPEIDVEAWLASIDFIALVGAVGPLPHALRAVRGRARAARADPRVAANALAARARLRPGGVRRLVGGRDPRARST